VAILDWGIGGTDFLRLLRERHPGIPMIYFSDSGALPYGKQTRNDLIARLRAVAIILSDLGARWMVVACNAGSTVLPELTLPSGLESITGVIEHGVRLALASDAAIIGVVGGKRTVRSLAYRRPLERDGRIVLQRVAQPLSALIEDGELESERLHRTLDAIVRPLRGVDALLLACTHYPAVATQFASALPGVRLLDPAPAMVDFVSDAWFQRDGMQDGVAETRFMTTGDPEGMRQSAFHAFGIRIPAVSILRADLNASQAIGHR
jgi:glutamate racemase